MEKAQSGPKAKERREAGKLNMAESARVMGRHRNFVRALVERGELERDEDGYLDAEAVEEMANELVAATTDPAIEHLKTGFQASINHNERMFGTYMTGMEAVMKIQNETISTLARELKESNAAQVEVYRAHREIMLARGEQQATLKEQEQATETKSKFVNLAETAIEQFLAEKSALGPLRHLLKTLSSDQMAKLTTVLSEDQIESIATVSSLLEKKEQARAAE